MALDELEGTQTYADKYSTEEKTRFDAYVERQIAKIEIPNKDEAYLRERIVEMYAYPAKNYLKAHA